MKRRTATAKAKSVKVERVVAPGMRGAENYLGSLAGGVARTGSLKGLIEEQIARGQGLVTQGFADANIDYYFRTYRTSLWIYVAISQIAQSLASVPVIAEARTKSTWEPALDSDIQAVLDNPSPFRSTRDIIEIASIYLETTGVAALVANHRGGDPMQFGGPIVSLSVLRPSLIQIVPGDEYVKKFVYNVVGNLIDIDPRNCEMGRYSHPESEYWGLSPIATLPTTIDIDAKVEEYNDSSLSNGGIPDVALETDRELGRNAKRYKRQFELEYMRPGKNAGVVVLDAGLKLKPVGLPPKDMQFQDSARMSKRRILAAFGVPPLLVMDLDDASVLANADTQLKLFWKSTLPKKAAVIEQVMTRLFQKTYGPKFRVRFDFNRVDALKDQDKEHVQAVADYQAGIITKNEARAKAGLAAVDGGDEFKAAPEPSAFAAPFGKGLVPVRRPQATVEFKRLAAGSFRRQAELALPRLRAPMRRFFEGQRDRVLAAFSKHRAELGAGGMALRSFGSSAVARKMDHVNDTIVSQLFDTHAEAEAFLKEVGPIFLLGLVDAANEKIAHLSPDAKAALTASSFNIRSFYAHWGASRVVDINRKTYEDIRDVLNEAFDEGLGVREIEDRLVAKFRELAPGGSVGDADVTEFPEYRLERIARTESISMLNNGSYAGTMELISQGANIRKSWLSIHDNITRDSHALADEQTSGDPIPFTQKFSNGLLHPHDPDAPAAEIVNCRCTLIETVLD